MTAHNKKGDPLPKILNGAVCQQWVKCGKKNCKCASGSLHGPYYYRFWRENGKLRKEYIKRTDVQLVAHLCRARRKLEQQQKQSQQLWQGLQSVVRSVEQSNESTVD